MGQEVSDIEKREVKNNLHSVKTFFKNTKYIEHFSMKKNSWKEEIISPKLCSQVVTLLLRNKNSLCPGLSNRRISHKFYSKKPSSDSPRQIRPAAPLVLLLIPNLITPCKFESDLKNSSKVYYDKYSKMVFPL